MPAAVDLACFTRAAPILVEVAGHPARPRLDGAPSRTLSYWRRQDVASASSTNPRTPGGDRSDSPRKSTVPGPEPEHRVEPPPPRLRRQRRSTIGRAAVEPDDDGPLARAENSMDNDRVADSEETDPEAGKVFDVPDPDTGRVVGPELVDPERRAQHRRWVLDQLERWIP